MGRKRHNKDSLDMWFEDGLLFRSRTIYLESNIESTEYCHDEISFSMATRLLKSMEILESANFKPITIILNSPGGYVEDGFAMYDRIKESACDINMVGYGKIMSMATIVLQAGYKRYLAPNTWLMIHDGTTDLSDVSAKSHRNWAEALIKINEKCYEIFLKQMKKKNRRLTLKKVEAMCQNDNVFDANRAIEIGLADDIYRGKEMIDSA